MLSPLVPCPGCSRHVRSGESVCPFCGSGFDANPLPSPIPGTSLRLGRGAMFVFASALTVAGCGSTVGGGDTVDNDAATQDQVTTDNGGIAPAYGLPVDSGNGGLRYGAPPPPDGG